MKAKNGMDIQDFVTLIGKSGQKNCWRAEIHITHDGNTYPMAMSHHDSEDKAGQWAKDMQQTYLAMHNK